MKKIAFLFLLFVSLAASSLRAQSVMVSAKIDSTQIKIGQQTKIRLQVSANAGQKVIFPAFRDTIVGNVFLVKADAPETKQLDNNKVEISKAYTVTSFDSALYYLPPMVVKVDNKDYPTSALSLKVMTVPVDTVHADRFYGEKALMKAPFVWSDWIGMFIFSVLALLLIAVLVYFSIRLHDNKPIIKHIKLEPKLTPHQLAMKEIEEIKEEKLELKKEDPKAYYTRLTEAIRKYIKDRFHFNAMEMTSQEIIDQLMELKDKEALSDLSLLFRTADLVKFAKHAPELNENDANLVKAVDFINQTKAEEETKPQQPTEITVVEKRSLRTKRLLVSAIVALSLAIAGCLVYIGFQLYELLSW
jgi:hypothetical protein